MMFVAGALMWANTREHYGTIFGGEEAYEFDSIEFEYKGYGWPIVAKGKLTGNAKYPNGSEYVHSPGTDITREFKSTLGASLDEVIAIIILGIIWFLCEWLIYYGKKESARRRAPRKQVEGP
jgi:hypothetical protein